MITQSPETPVPSLVCLANDFRDRLRAIEVEARNLLNHPSFSGEQSYAGQHGEMKAQTMLAVRHLEDARMRFGKVCQYAGDGVSIFDKA